MVDSPCPAAAYRYAARQRADAERTSSRRSSAGPTVIGLPERLASTVAPASAASALGGTGTHMSSQISTCSTRPGTSSAANSRSGPNGTVTPAEHDGAAAAVVAGGELPALVELPVVRQVRLRRDAEDPAAVDHDRAVEEPVAVPQRRPDDEHRPQVRRRRDQLGDRRLHRVEQRVLQEQVVDRVAGQRELGEDRDRDALLVAARAPAPAPRAAFAARVGDGVGTVQAATRAKPWA